MITNSNRDRIAAALAAATQNPDELPWHNLATPAPASLAEACVDIVSAENGIHLTLQLKAAGNTPGLVAAALPMYRAILSRAQVALDVLVPPRLVTAEGTVWTRRRISEDGTGCYAPEAVGDCPSWVLVTGDELARDYAASPVEAVA